MPHRTSALRALRLMHTSDCHLGKEPGVVTAFRALLEACRHYQVDALLIVGDLFDSGNVPDEMVRVAVDGLCGLGIPTLILPGNHDPIGPGSVYGRFRDADPAAHVHVLDAPDGTWLRLPELSVTFWGRPTAQHTRQFRPLANTPAPPTDTWGVLLAHGHVTTSDDPTIYGSPIYPRDLAPLKWDYLALGHADRYRVIDGHPIPACYPGDTAHSRGSHSGAVVVLLQPGAPVEFEWISLNVTAATGARAVASGQLRSP